MRNADDLLHTEPIASAAETSVVIVAFHASLLFSLSLFFQYTFVHLFLIQCPDFSSISPFPALPSSPSPLTTGGPPPAHSAQRREGLGGRPAAGAGGAGLGRMGSGEAVLAAMRAARRTLSRPYNFAERPSPAPAIHSSPSRHPLIPLWLQLALRPPSQCTSCGFQLH